jgi:hypothetical protein
MMRSTTSLLLILRVSVMAGWIGMRGRRGAHNLFKEHHGFTARRQPDGDWIIRNAGGDPIL